MELVRINSIYPIIFDLTHHGSLEIQKKSCYFPKNSPRIPIWVCEILNRFLINEYQIINRLGNAWNHQPIGIGTWDGLSNCHDEKQNYTLRDITKSPPVVSLFRFAPVIVMPFYDAIPFTDLQQVQKKKFFPLILPSLWAALCQGVHGDLSESNILIDRI